MSFFKSNKTNTTAATTETTATEENTNKGGGLLTTLAIAGGTIVGITAAVVGGPKIYKHFHHDDETINSDDDFIEEDEDVNESPVEDFKEVDTEVTENNETVKAEEAKTEETKKSCWDAFKDPKEAAPAEADEAKVEEPVKKAPVEDTTTKTEETNKPEPKETVTMKFERMLGEAVSRIPYDKPESVDLAFYIRCVGGYLREIDMDEAGNTGRFVIAEHCIAMTDLVSKAIIHIGSTKIDDLDEFRGVYGDIKRLQREFKASKIMDFTQKPDLCKEKFEDTLNMVAQNLLLTKKILKLQEANATASKTSSDETKTADKVDGETKSTENCFDVFNKEHKESNKVEGENQTSTKSSDENQKLMELIHKCTGAIPVIHPEKVDVKFYIRCMGGYLQKLDRTSLSKDELLQLNEECEDMTKSVSIAIRNIARNKCDDIDDVISSIDRIHKIENELLASKIMDSSTSPNIEKKYFDKRVKRACEKLNDIKEKLTAGETKTAENTEGETKTSANESPSETQIGNSTVVSDDGETVTLKTMVSQESIDNVNDIISIVSKIPNRDNPEMNDMAYFIRVIGSRIHGITEPEATFIAYDDASKSNKFIDACTDVCSMAGKAICNLANSGKNPLTSMQWIDRCKNELIASGIIDNTCDPNAYRSAILKAHGDAMDKLSKMVSGETKTDIDKVTGETKTDTKSSDETQAEDTLTYTMSEKIQEAVQQSDETAATAAPEPDSQAPMSPEASSLAAKLQEVGNLMRAKKWSDVSEFYKTQLTPYLADDGLSKELRDEIMGIKTKATNMMMSQKQLEAKQKAASAKASKKASKKRRRH